jgi:hypothetical protein
MSATHTSPVSFAAAWDTYVLGFEAFKALVLAVSAAESPELRQTALDTYTDCLVIIDISVSLSSLTTVV